MTIFLSGNVSGGNCCWLELSGWELSGRGFCVVGVVQVVVVWLGVVSVGVTQAGIVRVGSCFSRDRTNCPRTIRPNWPPEG